jgi:hypothetical protein
MIFPRRENMKRVVVWKAALIVSASAITMSVASASVKAVAPLSFPYKNHIEQNIDHHQVGWIDIKIDQSGKGRLVTSFSNGKQIAGNEFWGLTTLHDANGKPVKKFLAEKGLDGSWGGHAREGHVEKRFQLTPDEMARVHRVTIKMGVRNCGFHVVGGYIGGDKENYLEFSTRKCAEGPTAATVRTHAQWAGGLPSEFR